MRSGHAEQANVKKTARQSPLSLPEAAVLEVHMLAREILETAPFRELGSTRTTRIMALESMGNAGHPSRLSGRDSRARAGLRQLRVISVIGWVSVAFRALAPVVRVGSPCLDCRDGAEPGGIYGKPQKILLPPTPRRCTAAYASVCCFRLQRSQMRWPSDKEIEPASMR